jgi:type I restriction enzyme M protein
MSEHHRKQLETQLWNIANTLRGRMNADEFRDYILGFIFFKYLSEKQRTYANRILQPDGIQYKDVPEHPQAKELLKAVRENSIDQIGFYLPPADLFGTLARKGGEILEDVARILRDIEQSTMGHESEDDFDHLFESIDLNAAKLGKSYNARNAALVDIFRALNEIDFALDDTESDVLGDAYEYLIGKFASGAGKTAGEFYTPQQVSKILAKLVTSGKKRVKSVYDPTCGSGSLLLRVTKEVDKFGMIYGQERNPTTYNLARMNMILHDVNYRNFDIRNEDTLTEPQHPGERFEAIVANPPFSAKWKHTPILEGDERFSKVSKLAPQSKADFAFIQHMIHHLDDNGQMAVVAPHGVLFRGGAEALIRRFLIEDRNFLDAVIGLPANIFYGTSIPTCILVFKRCREHPDNVLFIDASRDFEKEKNQNELSDEHVQIIVDTYRKRVEQDKYSYLAPLEEIAENDYNLNIPRYVDTFEEEDSVDLAVVSKELRELQTEISGIDKEIAGFCKELGIDTPF